MREASIPGAIVGVWRKGKAPYVRAFGVRDTASGEPMTTDLSTRIGSVTKSFVVTAVLQLVDQGKVRLDDPIGKHVAGVPEGDKVTIRQLAGMRSGLYSYTNEIVPEGLAADPGRQWTVDELLAISFSRPLEFKPGTKFDYSNTNTVLLGRLVEQISGQSLSAYIDEHIARPEGLAHTVLPTDASFPAPHAQGYTDWGQPAGGIADATDWNPAWAWAAGAMTSTVDDLHTWARVLGTGKLLEPGTQRQRLRFRPAPGEGGATYGLGIMNNNGWIGHDGNLAGYITFPFYLPSQRTTMVVMLNSNVNVLGSVGLMRAITKVITPNDLWPKPPKAEAEASDE
jgi:D-alanyl-D-alanine carboxypeptidase